MIFELISSLKMKDSYFLFLLFNHLIVDLLEINCFKRFKGTHRNLKTALLMSEMSLYMSFLAFLNVLYV